MRHLFSGLSILLLLGACQQGNPAEPLPILGEPVTWGQGFAVTNEMQGTAPAQPTPAMPAMPSTAKPMGGPSAGSATMMWGGGESQRGSALFAAKCASCHSARGSAPVLDHQRLADKDQRALARIIAHGHGDMPSFMSQLDRQILVDLIAYLQSLKTPDAAPRPSASSRPQP